MRLSGGDRLDYVNQGWLYFCISKHFYSLIFSCICWNFRLKQIFIKFKICEIFWEKDIFFSCITLEHLLSVSLDLIYISELIVWLFLGVLTLGRNEGLTRCGQISTSAKINKISRRCGDRTTRIGAEPMIASIQILIINFRLGSLTRWRNSIKVGDGDLTLFSIREGVEL